ncbi:MAG: hypothetical protein HY286_01105 [Planctomycetes bacterium]|nr:hypothetical protein [Planctomycetota bacterium]
MADASEQQRQDDDSELLGRLAAGLPRHTRYKLQGEVARGGMGAIIKVWDEEIRRTLAMKVILGKGNDNESSAEFKNWVLREIGLVTVVVVTIVLSIAGFFIVAVLNRQLRTANMNYERMADVHLLAELNAIGRGILRIINLRARNLRSGFPIQNNSQDTSAAIRLGCLNSIQ